MTFITSIDQIRLATPLSISNKIEHWQPFLDDAEDVFIRPVITRSMYNKILSYLTLENPDDHVWMPDTTIDTFDKDAFFLELLRKIRKAEALYAVWLGIDEMAVNVSSSGVQILASETNKPAPQFMIMNLKETCLTRAHRQIDTTLQFIWEWRERLSLLNDQFQLMPQEILIRDADQFQTYADIHSSRRVFLSLIPVIKSIEQKYIIPMITQGTYKEILDDQSADTNNPEITPLYQLLLPAIVHLTMARALLEISIDILDWGVFNTSVNTFNNVQYKAQVNDQRISVMHQANQRDGEAELKAVQEYLDNHARIDLFYAYFVSPNYVGPANALHKGEFINDVTKSFFAL